MKSQSDGDLPANPDAFGKRFNPEQVESLHLEFMERIRLTPEQKARYASYRE